MGENLLVAEDATPNRASGEGLMTATPRNNRQGRKSDPVEFDEDAAKSALWAKTRAGDRDAYEALVDSYLPLVKVTVSRMAINLPTFISREELYSVGCVGLVSAVERYDPGRDARFTTYAITRIRGAVLDDLRSHDVLGRVVRDRVNRIEKAESELLSCNAVVSPEDVAAAAGLSMDEYWDAEMAAQAAKRISLSESSSSGGARRSLEDIILPAREDNPGARMEAEEILEIVMEMLTDKEKQLVVMYYEEELTLKEIGEIMKITESRVCQIHGAMIQKIRKRLEKMGIPVYRPERSVGISRKNKIR
jgi:RNA polymerase sigma factor for flagellar operon FliA